ncbi:MAG: formylglycine-generating enzyme family protein [Planctomycetaceae bacterium]|nr:formylglycine-generating enzyme family protein [Planctomycetaceae bacterium]
MRQLLIATLLLAGAVALFFYAFETRPSVTKDEAASDPDAETAEAVAKPPADSMKPVPPPEFQSDPRVQGMVWIPAGEFTMGAMEGAPDEFPPHRINLTGFWMDETEVTNRQFKEFVDATGYVTLPERKPELRSIQPGSGLENVRILDEFNVPGSICSLQLKSREEIDPQRGPYSWWQYVPGANWMHPGGPDTSIEDLMDHPVVHVTWPDAIAYCKWAGKALPTEAQWEYAARGGREGMTFPWGAERNPEGEWLNNIWQGEFPIENTTEDGFARTAPVKSYPPNDWGLYDVSGNVWEWCADYYHPDYYQECALIAETGEKVTNPAGSLKSYDPQEPGITKRIQRGGSFMCSDQYCIGYRVTARMKGEEDTGAFHTGFRCVVTPEMLKTKAE